MMLKDTSGNKSLTATMAIISFLVVMVKVLLNDATMTLAGSTYTFGTINAATIAAIFGPILGTYLGRRWGDPVTAVEISDAGSKPGDGAA